MVYLNGNNGLYYTDEAFTTLADGWFDPTYYIGGVATTLPESGTGLWNDVPYYIGNVFTDGYFEFNDVWYIGGSATSLDSNGSGFWTGKAYYNGSEQPTGWNDYFYYINNVETTLDSDGTGWEYNTFGRYYRNGQPYSGYHSELWFVNGLPGGQGWHTVEEGAPDTNGMGGSYFAGYESLLSPLDQNGNGWWDGFYGSYYYINGESTNIGSDGTGWDNWSGTYYIGGVATTLPESGTGWWSSANGAPNTNNQGGTYYIGGVATTLPQSGTGEFDGLRYSNGALLTGVFEGLRYSNGALLNGVFEGLRYSNGALLTGLYQGVYYIGGQATDFKVFPDSPTVGQTYSVSGRTWRWSGTRWDAQLPAHKSTHATGGSDALTPADIGAASTTHTHAIADTTGLQTALDGKASTTHKSTHAIGGSDALTPEDIGAAPTNNPTFTGVVTGGNRINLTEGPGEPPPEINVGGRVQIGTEESWIKIDTLRISGNSIGNTEYQKGIQFEEGFYGNWEFLNPLTVAAPTSANHAARKVDLDGKASTTHKSTHATGGSDALTPEDIGALGLSANSYVIARPGDNLATKYGEAKVLTPQGNARSATNRASLIILPGAYFLAAELVIDTEFVDIIGLGAQVQSPAVFVTGGLQCGEYSCEDLGLDGGVALNVTANDVRVSGISVGGYKQFKIGNNKPLQVFENCVGGNGSFGGHTVSGTFTNCIGLSGSFGGIYGGSATGTFTNCKGEDTCFGGGGIASGTFTRCTALNGSFGGGGTASGTFTDCAGGEYSFGGVEGAGTLSGKLMNCITSGSFQTLTAPITGKARMINCIDGNGDIIEGEA